MNTFMYSQWGGVPNNENSFKWLNSIHVCNLMSMPLLTISKWNWQLVQELPNLRPLSAVWNSGIFVLKCLLVPKTALTLAQEPVWDILGTALSEADLKCAKEMAIKERTAVSPPLGTCRKAAWHRGHCKHCQSGQGTGKVPGLRWELNRSPLFLVFPRSKP